MTTENLKKMRKIIFFCLFALLGCSNSHPHRLAICAMFKNEAPWLKEWIDYHSKVLEVGHFYLYNNESTDDYQAVLQPYIDAGVVELIDWDCATPSHLTQGAFMDAPWSAAQLGAYNDCLKNRALGQATWVAMIDIDEFIVPVHGVQSFYSLLKKAEKRNKGTLKLFWRVFGTSGVESLAEGELLTEKLTHRAPDHHPWNQLVKSLHRPEAVSFCLVHIAEKLNPPFRGKQIPADEARIHHYWTRTENFCTEKRKPTPEKKAEFAQLNLVEDRAILQYTPQIKN